MNMKENDFPGSIAGGLAATLKPFAALYVLILAILGPLVTKESKRIYQILNKVFKWQTEKPKVKKETNLMKKGLMLGALFISYSNC